MAAYAALVSLMHIIDQIQLHPRPPISLHKIQVKYLTENVTFLQEFLEGYSHNVGYSTEPDPLESRIADAAYAAEDIIESHIVDQILAGDKISSMNFYKSLEKVIEDMDSIKKEVMEIKEKTGIQYQLQRISTASGSLRPSPTRKATTMVGFDDVLHEVMDKLTGEQSNLQIIPIVGMGGIGKTTLARKIKSQIVFQRHFDVRGLVSISQEYQMREILLELVGGRNLSQMNEYELGDKLHKRLSGLRYLIIIDDIWDIEVWNQLKSFFPDNNNGSRIILTTRLSNLASQVADFGGIEMGFLDEGSSWNLFSKIVFGKECCPLELEEIGKKIVKNCRGVPLSIVVIGGLLAEYKHTREYWEYIREKLNSFANSEDKENCLKILHMSYSQLPIYLKPCFLYMGAFKEDRVIYTSTLIKLWVAEGFVKPISGKTLEEIAEGYLKELINRNLVVFHGLDLDSTGVAACCDIHDLLKDLCLREAHRDRFYNVIRQHSLNLPQSINNQRRIVISYGTLEDRVLDALQSMSQLGRSLIWDIEGVLPTLNFRLLRILKAYKRDLPYKSEGGYFLENMFQLVNSRFLAVKIHKASHFPSSFNLLWNLHTLIVENSWEIEITAPVEIWSMPQLRHVEFLGGLYLPDPPSGYIGRRDNIVLGNLQTLGKIINFKCGKEVVQKIPNIKKLRISYNKDEGRSRYYLNNLDHLHKLEFLHCDSFPKPRPRGTAFLQNLTFPHSLKKLILHGTHVHWEDMLEKISVLPLLEKLELEKGSFKGRKWETVEGQFRSLKLLAIRQCYGLEFWTTESSHFPCLERLKLVGLKELKEIPSGVGDIPTMRSIKLRDCTDSVIISAQKILEKQEELHGEVGLRVKVLLSKDNEKLGSFASPNVQLLIKIEE